MDADGNGDNGVAGNGRAPGGRPNGLPCGGNLAAYGSGNGGRGASGLGPLGP